MSFKTKFMYLILMAAGLASWVLGIGGLSATTQTCNGLDVPNAACYNQIRLIWMRWAVFPPSVGDSFLKNVTASVFKPLLQYIFLSF